MPVLDVGLLRRRQSVPGDLRLLLHDLVHKGDTPTGALADAIRAHGQRAVKPLIEVATDRSLLDRRDDTPEAAAPVQAIHLLGELAAREAVAPLVALLDRAGDDFLQETLAEALGRIGPPAIASLRAVLSGRQKHPFVCGCAAQALAAVALHHPGSRSHVIDALVARLGASAAPSPEDEAVNGYVINALLDIEAVEAAPAIAAALLEDRVDTLEVSAEDVRLVLGEAAGLPPPSALKGIELHLRCTRCNHSRPHDVKRVYYDAGALDRAARDRSNPEDDEIVIPQRITCPKCGAVDQYRLTPAAYLAVTAQLIGSLATRAGGNRHSNPNTGVVSAVHFGLADGTRMHPRAACRVYQERVAACPLDPDLRVRYGNILSFLGYLEEAKEQHRAALTLEPQDNDALLNLGRLARATGDGSEARSAFRRLLLLAPMGNGRYAESGAYVSEAQFELDQLALPRECWSTGIPVAYHVESPALEQAVPAPAARSAAALRKVGRNDRCPCGSGVKYKKCHGR